MLAALSIHVLALTAAILGSPSTPQDDAKPKIFGVRSPAPNPALPELGFDHVNYSLRILPASRGWIAVPPSDQEAAGDFGLGTLVSADNTVEILGWEDPGADLAAYTEDLESKLEVSLGLELALAKRAPVNDWCLEAVDSFFILEDPDYGIELVMAYRNARRGAFFYEFTMVGNSGIDATSEAFQYALRKIDVLAKDPVGSSELPIPGDATGNHWTRSAGIFEDHLTEVRAVAPPGWRLMETVELRDRFYDSALGLVNADESLFTSYTIMPLPPMLDPTDLETGRDWQDLAMNGFLSAETNPTELSLLGEPLLARHFEREDDGYRLTVARASVERSGIGILLDFGYDGELDPAEIARLLQESLDGFTAMDTAACEEVATRIRSDSAAGWINDSRTLRGGSCRDFKRSMAWTPPTANWQIAGPGKAERFGRSMRVFASELGTGEQFIVHAFRSRSTDMERAWDRLVKRELGEFTDELFPVPTETRIGTRPGWIAEVPDPTGGTLATLGLVLHGGVRYECILWGPDDREALPAIEAAFGGLVIPEAPEARTDFSDGVHTDRLLGFRMRAPSADWTYEPIKMSRRDSPNRGACAFFGPKGGRVMVTAVYLDPEDDDATADLLHASYLANLMGAAEGQTSCESATFLGQRAVVIKGEAEGAKYQHAVLVHGHVLYQLSASAEKGPLYPMADFEHQLEFLR